MSGTIGIGTTGVQLAAIGQYMQQGGPYPLNATRQGQQTMWMRVDADPATQGQQRRLSSFQQRNLRYTQGNGSISPIQAPSQSYINIQASGIIYGSNGAGGQQAFLATHAGQPGTAGLNFQVATGTTSYVLFSGVTGIVGGGGGGGEAPAFQGGDGGTGVTVQGGGAVVYQGSTGTIQGGGGGGGAGGVSAPSPSIVYDGGGGGGGASYGGGGGNTRAFNPAQGSQVGFAGTATTGGAGGTSLAQPGWSGGGAGGGLGQPGQAGQPGKFLPGQQPAPGGVGGAGGASIQGSFAPG
jgi:hypothetical protein